MRLARFPFLEIAGIYSPHRRRNAGSAAVFPNPLKVPELMRDFGPFQRFMHERLYTTLSEYLAALEAP
jgi:hypothetical protein